ncbi:hypothetical protein Taro_022864, partial [Colocasia esculenta]|nr:hypothetical protein [Colocasia esculenta]
PSRTTVVDRYWWLSTATISHPDEKYRNVRQLQVQRSDVSQDERELLKPFGSYRSLRVLWALGYNQLVGHVGIHGQRSLTEALNKDSLVW